MRENWLVDVPASAAERQILFNVIKDTLCLFDLLLHELTTANVTKMGLAIR